MSLDRFKIAAILDCNENNSGIDTMDKMLSGSSCKAIVNVFFFIICLTSLVWFLILYTSICDQSRNLTSEGDYIRTINNPPHTEERAVNLSVLVNCRPAIKTAMQKEKEEIYLM